MSTPYPIFTVACMVSFILRKLSLGQERRMSLSPPSRALFLWLLRIEGVPDPSHDTILAEIAHEMCKNVDNELPQLVLTQKI